MYESNLGQTLIPLVVSSLLVLLQSDFEGGGFSAHCGTAFHHCPPDEPFLTLICLASM